MNDGALNQLLAYGELGTRAWLLEHGMTRHQVDNALKSGKLVSLLRGVVKRPGVGLTWQGVATSLNREMGPVWVGGLSALEEGGFAHYLRSSRTIELFGTCEEPSWLPRLDLNVNFEWYKSSRLWTSEVVSGLKGVGSQDWFGDNPYLVAYPEQAILELLMGVPEKIGFEHASQLMEGLTSLSPRRLDWLLLNCKHIRVKRLFFYLGKRNNYPWYRRLDPSRYELGTGKRVIANPGELDTEFLITVPRGFDENK